MTIAIERYRAKPGHSSTPVAVRYSPNGRFLVSADQTGAIIARPRSRFSFRKSARSPYSPLTGIWFTEDQQSLLAGCQGGRLLLYSLPKLHLTAEVHLKPDDEGRSPVLSGAATPILNWVVLALAPASDSNLYAVLEFRDFFTIRRDGLQATGCKHQPGPLLESSTASPDGQVVFFGDDLGYVYRYRPREMRLELFAEHREQVPGVDMRSMQRTVVNSAAGIAALALSPDGALVASSSRAGGVQLWDTNAPPERDEVLSGPARRPSVVRAPSRNTWLRGLCFLASTGALAIGGDDGILEIWDSKSSRVVSSAKFPEGIRGLAASPDASELAVACEDGSLYLLPGESLGLA